MEQLEAALPGPARGFRFEVEPTSPQQPARIAQHFGARGYAHNWALAQVKANLEARKADPAVPPLAWNFYELRRIWNQAKHQVAPLWRACSKEADASGIADLMAALGNWSDAKHGRRAGSRVGSRGSRPATVTRPGALENTGALGAWSPRAGHGCCR